MFADSKGSFDDDKLKLDVKTDHIIERLLDEFGFGYGYSMVVYALLTDKKKARQQVAAGMVSRYTGLTSNSATKSRRSMRRNARPVPQGRKPTAK